MIQLLSAIAVAVLTVVVGPLLRGEVSGRLAKRIRIHAELRAHLDEGTAAMKTLDDLIAAELIELKNQELNRLTRKINGTNVAALIFVAALGGGIVYGLVAFGISLSASLPPVAVLVFVLAGIAGLLTVGLAAVGVGTIYEPPKSPEQKAAEKAAKRSRG